MGNLYKLSCYWVPLENEAVNYRRGHSNFFSGRFVRPGFPNLGLVSGKLPWKWWLVSGLSSKTGVWELIIYQISKLFDKNRGQIGVSVAKNCHIFWKLLIWRQNLTFLFQMRVLWKDLSLNWGSCERQERREKGVLRAAHPHTCTNFSGECPPPG